LSSISRSSWPPHPCGALAASKHQNINLSFQLAATPKRCSCGFEKLKKICTINQLHPHAAKFRELAASRRSIHKPMALNIVLKLVCRSLSPSSSPVPQFGGLWQPRFTMPDAPLMNLTSAVFLPLSTQALSSSR